MVLERHAMGLAPVDAGSNACALVREAQRALRVRLRSGTPLAAAGGAAAASRDCGALVAGTFSSLPYGTLAMGSAGKQTCQRLQRRYPHQSVCHRREMCSHELSCEARELTSRAARPSYAPVFILSRAYGRRERVRGPGIHRPEGGR